MDSESALMAPRWFRCTSQLQKLWPSQHNACPWGNQVLALDQLSQPFSFSLTCPDFWNLPKEKSSISGGSVVVFPSCSSWEPFTPFLSQPWLSAGSTWSLLYLWPPPHPFSFSERQYSLQVYGLWHLPAMGSNPNQLCDFRPVTSWRLSFWAQWHCVAHPSTFSYMPFSLWTPPLMSKMDTVHARWRAILWGVEIGDLSLMLVNVEYCELLVPCYYHNCHCQLIGSIRWELENKIYSGN